VKHGQESGSETGFLWLCLICIRYLLVYVDSWDAPSGDALTLEVGCDARQINKIKTMKKVSGPCQP